MDEYDRIGKEFDILTELSNVIAVRQSKILDRQGELIEKEEWIKH